VRFHTRLKRRAQRWRSDDAIMFLCGGAVAICLLALAALFALLVDQSRLQFWPEPVYQWETQDGTRITGQIIEESPSSLVISVGYQSTYSNSVRRVTRSELVARSRPVNVVRVEHSVFGILYGVWIEDSESAILSVTPELTVPMQGEAIVRWYYPNQLNLIQSLQIFADNIANFLFFASPDSANDAGVLPALVGTVVMVLLMTIFVMPLGVLAAIYLHEYAAQGRLTSWIRIAVHNLAAIPSVVYGVFGLGVFVYGLGSEIDSAMYSDSLPSPTFGEPGLLWASLTLALLTLPVVIVATEEGLARVPRSIIEASYALGATRAETLLRLILPLIGPAMMTGLILAIARAAGEVAPLMLVGVVEFAPDLPITTDFPFLRLDQKFMHLGYHIYDLGFQSIDIETTRPRVFATALLLFVIVMVLNILAVLLRNRLDRKYRHLLE
jgi:phosphate transport system permease protein